MTDRFSFPLLSDPRYTLKSWATYLRSAQSALNTAPFYVATSVTGAANNYHAQLSPESDEIPANVPILLYIPVTNTGASTLNVNEKGAYAILADGVALRAGQLQSGRFYIFAWNGVNFSLLNPFLGDTGTGADFLTVTRYQNSYGQMCAYLGGTSSAMTTTTSAPWSVIPNGPFWVIGPFDVAANATLAINGTAAKNIAVNFGSLIKPGQMLPNRWYCLMYDGLYYQVLNPSSEWIDFNPTLGQAGSVAKNIQYCRYRISENRTVVMQFSFQITGAGVAGNLISVTVPYTIVNSGIIRNCGCAQFYDASTGIDHVLVINGNLTQLQFASKDTGGNNFGTVPAIPLSAGDYLAGTAQFQI